MPLPYNPLTQAHCDICTKIIQSSAEPEAVLKACIDCGLPAEEMLATLQRQVETAKQIKRHFFPNSP